MGESIHLLARELLSRLLRIHGIRTDYSILKDTHGIHQDTLGYITLPLSLDSTVVRGNIWQNLRSKDRSARIKIFPKFAVPGMKICASKFAVEKIKILAKAN